VPQGRWRLEVGSLGFRATEREVDVPSGGAVRVDVELPAEPVRLIGIEVRSPGRLGETVLDAGAGPRPTRMTCSSART
jgi:hypothetical protein